jgi:hypothetical protein
MITGVLLVLVIAGEWASGRIDGRRLRRRLELDQRRAEPG